jgi:hypothetical protein
LFSSNGGNGVGSGEEEQMRQHRMVLVMSTVFAVLALGWVSWHWQEQGMAVARSYTAGDASLPQHVLIVAQGSAFKNELVSGLVKRLASRGVYVQVVDISGLPSVRESEWSAIVLVHTWEFGRPPRDVKAFVDHLSDRHRVFAVTTSGSGRQKMPGVDAISAASVMSDVSARLDEVSARLDVLLGSSPLSRAP